MKRASIFVFTLVTVISQMTLLSCKSAPKRAAGEEVVERSFSVPDVNSEAAMEKPVTIMLSIDGYRADYNSLFSPPNLLNLERSGAAAKSLKPSYPSKTFPNHYTLATGLYPARHGIVTNDFYDPDRKASYAISDRQAVEDGTWYLGEPIWITAQRAGFRTASFFWVGSEASIQDMAPNSSYRYSEEVPNAARVDQVLTWLQLPKEIKPHLILMYFSAVDTAGHKYGTKSQELRDAVMAVDTQIGRLREGIKKASAANPNGVNLVVVSDHGMQDLDPAKTILIDESAQVAALLPKFKVVGRGPQVLLYLNEGESPNVRTAMRTALQSYARTARKPFRVLMTQAELKRFSYGGSRRVGDLVIEPDLPWSVGTKELPPGTKGGNHGWDPKNPTMHAVFFAEGPSFRERSILPTVENINVAPLILRTLGIAPAKGIDGNADLMKDILSPQK